MEYLIFFELVSVDVVQHFFAFVQKWVEAKRLVVALPLSLSNLVESYLEVEDVFEIYYEVMINSHVWIHCCIIILSIFHLLKVLNDDIFEQVPI